MLPMEKMSTYLHSRMYSVRIINHFSVLALPKFVFFSAGASPHSVGKRAQLPYILPDV